MYWTSNIGVYFYLNGTNYGTWQIYNNDTTQSKTISATIYPNTTYTVSFEHWASYPYGWGIVTGKPSVTLGWLIVILKFKWFIFLNAYL